MTRRGWTLACAALLTSCAGAPQPVASEAQAIAVAKERCALSPASGMGWHARLHDGQWHVWVVSDRDPKEPVMGRVDIRIDAKDGRAGDCNHGY